MNLCAIAIGLHSGDFYIDLLHLRVKLKSALFSFVCGYIFMHININLTLIKTIANIHKNSLIRVIEKIHFTVELFVYIVFRIVHIFDSDCTHTFYWC